jgi:hypothetical protein
MTLIVSDQQIRFGDSKDGVAAAQERDERSEQSLSPKKE